MHWSYGRMPFKEISHLSEWGRGRLTSILFFSTSSFTEEKALHYQGKSQIFLNKEE
jgi:hypothetical protein